MLSRGGVFGGVGVCAGGGVTADGGGCVCVGVGKAVDLVSTGDGGNGGGDGDSVSPCCWTRSFVTVTKMARSTRFCGRLRLCSPRSWTICTVF